MKLAKHYYSIMSGVAASLGSFFGKMITFSANELETSLLQKGIFVILMLASNAMVWRYFVKGLHSTDASTLVPTVISTASNFIISGLLGFLIFNEATNVMWWLGALMIMSGFYCILSEDERKPESHAENKTK